MDLLNENADLDNLVKKAQFGCQESMGLLAEQSQKSLFVYIYRLTLNYNLAEDLLQETLLEMVKSIKNLRDPKRFKAWLYKTAWGKTQHYFRDRRYEKVIQPMSTLDEEKLLERLSGSYGDGLKNLVNKELAQAIVDAMGKLKLRHRNILALRCCENLPYSEIAKIMDCSEMAAQVLFFRAKHSLKKKLSKHGFGKGLLLVAIGLFSQMTNPTEAKASTITASSVKVGFTATIIGTLSTKLWLTIAAILTAATFTIGSIVLFNTNDNSKSDSNALDRSKIKSFHYIKQAWDKTGSINPNLARGRSLSKGAYEQWYYFPEGIDGPLFMMMQKWHPQQKYKLCGWLQNGKGNYYYHSGEKTIYLYNCHLPMRYLNTRRLPSDKPEFTKFLNQVEGKEKGVDYIIDSKTGLRVGIVDDRFYNAEHFKSSISYNSMDEKSFDSFYYKWPDDTPIVDTRDKMHKRGWTYFKINGNINGQEIAGKGQIAFIYNTYREKNPWLELNIGDNLKVVDCSSGTYLASNTDKMIACYPLGSFFEGLARPWEGINTADLIRRDAIEKRIRFKTKALDLKKKDCFGKAEVAMFKETNKGQIKIVYTVDMDQDLVEKIEFSINDKTKEEKKLGTLTFTYLNDIDELTKQQFTEPTKIKIKPQKQNESIGMLWLMELAQGTLGQ